ncbi:IclR family transcriptional regulator C-terminal domain-containing protein [Streptomyces sp. KN37]|uniref:IclR family transcriptional regulator domain-containing protein n=1 Tax=Streptomyces sp. KN37 TaxID=3090667 RepID=UPI002A766015|nr:IclR family transcriptional regulator C-terminal domain-containing protein [Streptomyces sp. KN37]WPO73316.1 IclR family transcriptional regulator C-terminal domain-containing protein [Streptomyces sp. KN37]
MPEESVRPLERGLAVLRALAAAEPGQLRAGDLARATGLARSTVDRVVTTLARLGYVRPRGQELHLAPRLMELGNAYLAASGLTGEVAARTARLADELDESVSLAVPDGDGVRFVTQAARRRAMSVAFRIGDLLPPERCAPGALFADAWDEERWAAWRARVAAGPAHEAYPALPPGPAPAGVPELADRVAHARRSGWALDDQLIEPGLIAVAVPVRDAAGRVRYALSAVSHTSRHTAQGLAAAVLPRLRAEAEQLAGLSGTDAPPDADGRAPAREATDPAAAKDELGPGFLQSLARGLAVLRALGGARGEGLPLTALAEATGLPRATARRCLHTLEQAGYAAHDGRLFRPLPRILELGHAALSGLTFAELAEPHLRELADRVRQSASATVLDGTDIRYVARAATVRVMSVHITVGTRFPAYATAMGRVLLAGLPADERERLLTAAPPRALTPRTVTDPGELARVLDRAAAEGHATADQELEDGLRSVAVPVRDAAGRVVAAVNVAQHAGTDPLSRTRDALLPALRATAAAIETDLHIAARFNTVRMS